MVRIPWNPKLYQVLIRHSDAAAVYAGTYVYASFDPNNTADRRLRRFLNVMDGFPGYSVMVKDRKPLGPMLCPNEGLPPGHYDVSPLPAGDPANGGERYRHRAGDGPHSHGLG